jgi:hypothetical protein
MWMREVLIVFFAFSAHILELNRNQIFLEVIIICRQFVQSMQMDAKRSKFGKNLVFEPDILIEWAVGEKIYVVFLQ